MNVKVVQNCIIFADKGLKSNNHIHEMSNLHFYTFNWKRWEHL